MKRLIRVAVALLILLAGSGVSAVSSATASLRVGSITINPNPGGPQFGQGPLLPLIPVTVSYDDQAGSIIITEGGGVQYAFDSTQGGAQLKTQWADLGTVDLGTCSNTVGPYTPDATIAWGYPRSFYKTDGTAASFSGGQWLTDGGIGGELTSRASVSPDGFTITSVWSDPALAHQNFTCVSLTHGINEGSPQGFDFPGFAAPPPKPPKPAGPQPERENIANSTAYWVPAGNANIVDIGSSYGYDCAEKQYGQPNFSCITEYYIKDSRGRAGARRYLVEGNVNWTSAPITLRSPLVAGNLADAIGIAHSHVGYRYSWTRRWRRDSTRCLAGAGVHGNVVSNMPCETAANAIEHGNSKVGYASGTGTGYWPWLFSYPCKRRGDWTTCANKVGDSYRYKGAFPYRR